MARLDAATAKFAADLADDKSPLEPLKAAKAAVKFVENPSRSMAKAIVRAAMEKSASLTPVKAFGLLNEHYGRDWWGWEPETIWATLEKDHGLGASDDVRNLVMALQLAVNSNAPFEHWHVFEKVGLAFNLHHVDFGVVQPLAPEEASLTIYILRTIRPREEFEPEVLGYVAAVCHEAGLAYLPRELFTDGAQAYLEKIAPDESGVGHRVFTEWHTNNLPWNGGSEALKNQVEHLKAIKDYVRARL